jgi:hypothetical protein
VALFGELNLIMEIPPPEKVEVALPDLRARTTSAPSKSLLKSKAAKKASYAVGHSESGAQASKGTNDILDELEDSSGDEEGSRPRTVLII